MVLLDIRTLISRYKRTLGQFCSIDGNRLPCIKLKRGQLDAFGLWNQCEFNGEGTPTVCGRDGNVSIPSIDDSRFVRIQHVGRHSDASDQLIIADAGIRAEIEVSLLDIDTQCPQILLSRP